MRQTDNTATPWHALEISRVFDAPRQVVFEMWTTREHLARWWGPKDFFAPSLSLDFRPGGTYRHTIRSADGAEYRMQGVYREIVAPERIVFTFAWEDDAGSPKAWTVVTVTFEERDRGTLLTFRQEPFETVEERDSHQSGWAECLDRLQNYAAGL
jgi:uncharacterized protein YndB with AHSA1/START domain